MSSVLYFLAKNNSYFEDDPNYADLLQEIVDFGD